MFLELNFTYIVQLSDKSDKKIKIKKRGGRGVSFFLPDRYEICTGYVKMNFKTILFMTIFPVLP